MARATHLLLAALLLLVACDNKGTSSSESAASSGSNAGRAGANLLLEQPAIKEKLAYRHDIGMEMPMESIAPRFERARDACLKNSNLNCTLMQANISTANNTANVSAFATLSVRLPHAVIDDFQNDLLKPVAGEKEGDVILSRHSIQAEDLSAAFADVDRRLAQLMDYREKLTALAKRPDAKVEDLIKVESELSSVQSQIESLTGQQSKLNERITTEILNIDLRAKPDVTGISAPVVQAWRQGGRVLGENAGNALRFSIGALPWLPLIIIAVFIIRLIFRRMRR